VVAWKGRRHGPRQARRWASAWSPQQIASRLPVDYPDNKTMRISHEAIYQTLFVQAVAERRRATPILKLRAAPPRNRRPQSMGSILDAV